MRIKGLFWGVLLIIVAGIGGLVYRNALEHPFQHIACPLDAKICPDGTSVSRTGLACTFAACPPPNVSFANAGITFAVPKGFAQTSFTGNGAITAYELMTPASSTSARINISKFSVEGTSTPLDVIQQTAIGAASGAPVGITSFSSTVLGEHRFTIVTIERANGVIDTAYYLARTHDVLRFDAIDSGIPNWADSGLQVSTLPAHKALITLLTHMQML